MKEYHFPTTKEIIEIIKRPSISYRDIEKNITDIGNAVIQKGDAAIFEYSHLFDGVTLSELKVSPQEIENASSKISEELKQAIHQAYNNIKKFHQSQLYNEVPIETSKGITCFRKNVPIEHVGLYIPGGSAPLFSTVLMLGIPAQIAVCNSIILCTPPDKTGMIHPAILYCAQMCNIHSIYKVGGAQAIFAMAYGTQTIPKVDKIFGPGNAYVTAAKQMIQKTGTAIDLPAGPSELLVIADETSNSKFVAADLLSQAEHGYDSQVILIATQKEIIKNVLREIELQIEQLPRKETARKSLENSAAVLVADIDDAMKISNVYAPEHLILAVDNPDQYVSQIKNAGSVFLGNYSCESAGDYASGTNHTLPTYGYAKAYSGVSLDSFFKKITFQNVTKFGLQNIGKHIEIMAQAEGLDAHKNAVTVRITEIK